MTYQAARENVLKYQNEMMYFNRRLCDMHGFWIREGLSDSLESLTKKHDAARAKWVEAKALLAVTQ
jgi:hypothetical protein